MVVRKLAETNDQGEREFWSRTLLQMHDTDAGVRKAEAEKGKAEAEVRKAEAEMGKAEAEAGKAEAEARKAEAEKGIAEAALEATRLEEERKQKIIEDLKTVSEARADLMSKTSKDAADEAQLVSLAEQRADLEFALRCYSCKPQVDLSYC
jgi:uncharacterized protein (DUF3084 family)